MRTITYCYSFFKQLAVDFQRDIHDRTPLKPNLKRLVSYAGKNKYGILRCGAAQFEAIDKGEVLAWRRQDYQWEVLVADRAAAQRKYPKAVVDPATIDEIMLLYVKGERP